jgi:hypothetical protein
MTDIDLDRLKALLANADTLFMPFASRASLDIADGIKSIISVYPPQPARDRAKTFNTYVRGKGRYPKSAFVKNPREPGGYATKRVNKGQIKMTSQRMDASFEENVTQGSDFVKVNLSNRASYSGFVIGFENGSPHQQPFHKETGWASTEDAVGVAMGEVSGIMEGALQDFFRSLQ